MNLKKLVLHTDILLDHLVTPAPGPSVMRQLMREYFCYTTVFNAIELFALAETKREEKLIEDLLSSIKLLGMNAKGAPQYGRMVKRKDLSRHHAYVAGLCIESKLPLVTCNLSGFRKVKGLTVLTPNELLNDKKAK